MKLVVVTWDDAQASGGWTGAADVAHHPDRITSAGWLIRRDEVGVTICQSHNGEGRIADTLFVPAAGLRKLRTVAA